MLRQLSHHISSLVIFIIFACTNIFVDACNDSQISCTTADISRRWCCWNFTTCGTEYNSCIDHRTDPGSGVVLLIIFGIILIFCFCTVMFIRLFYMVRKTQSRTSVGGYFYTTPIQQPQYTYQQQPTPVGHSVAYVNPSTYNNSATSTYTSHEKLPPCYDTATMSTQNNYPVPSAPLKYVPDQETNFRL